MTEEYLPRRKRELDSLNSFNPFSYLTGTRVSEQKPLAQKSSDFFNVGKRGMLDFLNPRPSPRPSWFSAAPALAGPAAIVQGQKTALSFFSAIFSYFFYLSIITFFIFMILIVVHYTITPIFKFDSKTPASVNLSSDGQLTWTSGPASSDSQPVPGFNNLLNSDYTISFDVFISPDFSAVSSPRVVLYRSTSVKKLTATMDISKILTTFDDSNLIVYVDSMKNDLYIITQTTTTNGNVTPEPLPVITNVPIGSPFRIGIIFATNYVEVYINGKLEATRVLKGTLIGSIGSFYSPPSMVGSSVSIANLQYWPRILMPSELSAVGPALPAASFFTK